MPSTQCEAPDVISSVLAAYCICTSGRRSSSRWENGERWTSLPSASRFSARPDLCPGPGKCPEQASRTVIPTTQWEMSLGKACSSDEPSRRPFHADMQASCLQHPPASQRRGRVDLHPGKPLSDHCDN
ncbi:hypothetical protein V2G26_011878 [Clonostachys chloroleuca]